MDESGTWSVDFELLITHMKQVRNRTTARAQEFWESQKNDLSVQRDEKALSRESKAMKLCEEDIARIRAETGVGFKRLLHSVFSASMATALRPGSMTVEGGDEGRMALSSGELLQQAAQ